MAEESIPLREQILVITNPNRRKIYKLCKKEKLNITQLSTKMGLSYNSTFENIKLLEKIKLVERQKEKDGGEAIVVSLPMDPDRFITKLFHDLEKEENG